MKKFNGMAWISVVLISMLFLYGACTQAEKTDTTEAQSASSVVELSDQEVENLVRRSFQYVAMYNVINKSAMMEGNPMRTGWNDTFASPGLLDHTMKSIARPNKTPST
jgi:hypothetical protein